MKLIVGLGNPGKKYEGTRHNAGFMFVDKLVCHTDMSAAGECETYTSEDKFDSLMLTVTRKGEKFIFAKPQTFMNLSGPAVQKIMKYYDITPDDLIVVSDDVDILVGQVRIRHDGSSGGQKGLQNIIDILGEDKFTRIRIGVRPESGNADTPANLIDTTDLVLSKFSEAERSTIDETIEQVIGYILPFLKKKEVIPAHTINVG